MFCSSSVYGSKGRSKDYLPGQYHYNALCRGQYHYNALVEREYEICSPLVSFDLRCESVTYPVATLSWYYITHIKLFSRARCLLNRTDFLSFIRDYHILYGEMRMAVIGEWLLRE